MSTSYFIFNLKLNKKSIEVQNLTLISQVLFLFYQECFRLKYLVPFSNTEKILEDVADLEDFRWRKIQTSIMQYSKHNSLRGKEKHKRKMEKFLSPHFELDLQNRSLSAINNWKSDICRTKHTKKIHWEMVLKIIYSIQKRILNFFHEVLDYIFHRVGFVI